MPRLSISMTWGRVVKRLDITGQRFGLLVAASFERTTRGQSLWLCVCDCGTKSIKQLGNLRSGHTTSCGCLRSPTTTQNKTKHGMHGTPTYRSWQSMQTRCNNVGNHKYPSYGGRGIDICDRWASFDAFLQDMGERPPNTTLGRIDNDKGYSPTNCEWQPLVVQARNKRNTRLFLVDGVQGTLREHCERKKLNEATVRSRIYLYRWPVEKAFS